MVMKQLIAVAATYIFCGVGNLVILVIVNAITPLASDGRRREHRPRSLAAQRAGVHELTPAHRTLATRAQPIGRSRPVGCALRRSTTRETVRSDAVIDLESNIARGRIVLSLVTLVSVFVDPTTPHLASWMPVVAGPFAIDAHLFQLLCVHLVYGAGIYAACRRGAGSTTCRLSRRSSTSPSRSSSRSSPRARRHLRSSSSPS